MNDSQELVLLIAFFGFFWPICGALAVNEYFYGASPRTKAVVFLCGPLSFVVAVFGALIVFVAFGFFSAITVVVIGRVPLFIKKFWGC